ncbi:MAG: hypothetical protein Q9173_004113 [Seirophora scorigena]
MAPRESARDVGNRGARLAGLARIGCNLKSLNELAKQARADHIIHTGDFGFYDESSLDRIADKTLKHVAQYSPLLSDNTKRIIQASHPQQTNIKQRFSPRELMLSELPSFINKEYTLDVPVYTVWGACEDVRVLEKFRSGEYKVDKLHIIDEASSRLLEVGGIKLRLLGLGGAVVMHKLFDNGEGRTTIAGGQGTMWTTLLQMGELVDTANRVYDPTETRIFVTHASPAREGLLNQLSVTLKADFSVSAGLHFRYGSSYNEFSVNPTLDHYRGKLAASKASFNDVWETVKSEVEPAVSQNEPQQTLLSNALDIVNKMPSVANGGNPFGGAVPGQAAGGSVDESAFKNMWNFNLADAAFGYLVLEVEAGRIGTEMKAQGFNFAHRGTGGKPPVTQPVQAPAQGGPTNAVMQGVNTTGAPTGPGANRPPATPSAPSNQHMQQNQQQPRGQQPPPLQQQTRNQQPPAQQRPGPPPQAQPQQAKGPAQTGPQPGASQAPAAQVKPATPQPSNSSANVNMPPADNKQAPTQAAGVRNGSGPADKPANGAVPNPASPAVEENTSTGLFIHNMETEEAVRQIFPEEDGAKIAKVEKFGKSNFVVRFNDHESAKAALDRQPLEHKKRDAASSADGPRKPNIKWYQERGSRNYQRDNQGQGAATVVELIVVNEVDTRAVPATAKADAVGEASQDAGVVAVESEASAVGDEVVDAEASTNPEGRRKLQEQLRQGQRLRRRTAHQQQLQRQGRRDSIKATVTIPEDESLEYDYRTLPGSIRPRSRSLSINIASQHMTTLWGSMPFRSFVGLAVILLLSQISTASNDGNWTVKHEAGRCAMKGQCGKKSFFGGQLPCPDNSVAQQPDEATRKKLIDICGNKWDDGAICCDSEQIDALSSNLKRAESIISSCPACKENFFNLFCTFTCSPDQSLFVNVTDSQKANTGKLIVTELDNLWSDGHGEGFYDSCKDVKFGPTGGKAMDFIGGGAKNYTKFLQFLGDTKPFGSPFQINFPRPSSEDFTGMTAADPTPKACNDTDEAFRCACVDCAASCPTLPKVTKQEQCYVGALPCVSFAVIVVYSVFLLLLVTAVSGHVAYQKHSQRKSERLQLLQDAALSDDEDDEDEVRHAGFLEKPQREYWLNSKCDAAFARLGQMCGRFPLITIGASVVVVAVLSIGWINFAVETDPVRLWVSPSSAAATEKEFFDSNFGPFYRAEQAFLVNDTHPSGPGPVLSYETLAWWFDLENRVQRIRSMKEGVSLADVCFNPTGEACVVQSITGYFGGSFSNVQPDTWQEKIQHCTEQPGSQECLPAFQQPLQKDIILGGWEDTNNILEAEALITTWVVNNHPQGSREEAIAMDWEEMLKNLLQDAQGQAYQRGLRLSFSTEVSLEQQLNKSTNTDAKIVVISYIIMFLYASLALGSTTLTVRSILHNPANAMVQSKFTLGVIGIVIVLMSVSASVGLFSACGIKVTLIIAEVIPFLVLAVGVDNIFLIVHEFERVNLSHMDESVETRISKALGRMGPSILLSASTETVAFALGAAVGMPAVKNFAAYAAGAVLINALLQVTMFVSLLSLNQRRVESHRADCFPFIKVQRADARSRRGGQYGYEEEGGLQKFIRRVYAPALLNRKVKVSIVIVFLGIFTAGLALLPNVSLGLDQRIAFPRGSYLIPYFNDLDAYFNTGPPVYFVVRDLDVSQRSHQQELCARYSTCHSFSLTNVLEQESKRSGVSYITGSTASWLDDFFTWLNPINEHCCVERGRPCFENRDPAWNVRLDGMPEDGEFLHYLTKWLSSPTNEDCPFGGAAPYSNALVIQANSTQDPIPASHFRTSHTPLRSQSDFIQAYASARRIASEVSESQGIDVFPYSKFYIFFDQYASIVSLAGTLLGSAIAIIFFLTSLLLGSLATGLVVTITVAMIVIAILGTMALAHVSLNAISLVNLVIAVGIAVEFCAHIARAFQFPAPALLARAPSSLTAAGRLSRGRDARAWASLVNVGASVFSGITVTKFLGVAVLAFTRSKIFEIYYFRVWLALVVWAALHALVFLPVGLSLAGGEGYAASEPEGEVESDLNRRRYRALLPENGEDSDDF